MNERNLNRWAVLAAQGNNLAGLRLYRAILPEVKRLACRVPGGQWRDELVGAGLLGVAKSLKRYKAGRGFLPYALSFAKGSMLQFLRDESRLIRVPAWRVGKDAELVFVPIREAEDSVCEVNYQALETLIDAGNVALTLKPWGGRKVTLSRFRKKLQQEGLTG